MILSTWLMQRVLTYVHCAKNTTYLWKMMYIEQWLTNNENKNRINGDCKR